MATPRSVFSALGIPDPRDKTKQDLVRMYSDYISTGQYPSALEKGKRTVRQFGPPAGAASSEPGWGEVSEISDEEMSQDKGQIVEGDDDEDKASAQAAAAEEEAAVAEDAAAEGEDVAGGLAGAAPAKNTYEEEILKELEAARQEVLKQKKLSIADILGAGTIRKSAQLIRETEALNEQRQAKARELALDILMRKSESEDKRRKEEALAEYRKGIIAARMAAAEKGPQDPSQVRADRIAAKAMFPKLSEDQAYAKYLREVKYRPPAGPRPRDEDYRIRMGRLIAQQEAALKNQGPPVTPAEAAEIEQYKKFNLLQLINSGAIK